MIKITPPKRRGSDILNVRRVKGDTLNRVVKSKFREPGKAYGAFGITTNPSRVNKP